MRDTACTHNVIIDRDVIPEYLRLGHTDRDEHMLYRAFSMVSEMRDMACIHNIYIEIWFMGLNGTLRRMNTTCGYENSLYRAF